jgi:hypothetical protein
MSELAFNLNGEPFDLPLTATGWRVRRFKSKGAPEVVYGREGTPLVLPIDADMDDLRREARSEGRYRLDAIDEHSRPIAGAPPSYVCIHPKEPASAAPEPQPVAVRNLPLPGADFAIIEAMRVNSDLARSVVNQFPQMLESAAVLLRAADAAGMPARPLRPFELVAGDEEADDEEAEPEAPPAKQGGVVGFLEMLFEQVGPQVVTAILAGKLRVPGGLGAVLDGRRAATASAAAETQASSTPAGEPAPGRRVPAPAASSRAGRAGQAPTAVSAIVPATAELDAERAAATMRLPNLPANLPTIDDEDAAHFLKVLRALSMREAMYAQALAGELSHDELRAWIGELKQLSVPEAVAKIRAVLGTDADTASGRGIQTQAVRRTRCCAGRMNPGPPRTAQDLRAACPCPRRGGQLHVLCGNVRSALNARGLSWRHHDRVRHAVSTPSWRSSIRASRIANPTELSVHAAHEP